MKSIVITGSEASRNRFVDEYIKENKIKSFNIVRFDDRVKISDVREIKKIVSVKQPSGQKRIFILSSDITAEAQNALLKTVEELPNDCDFIFCAKTSDSLLPTIVSRSFIVRLENEEAEKTSDEYENMLVESICNSKDREKMFVDFLLLSSKIAASSEIEEIEKLIFSLRSVMLKIVRKEISCNTSSLNIICNLISSFTTLYPLLERNNLNKKITLDHIFLNSLFSDAN